MKTFKVDFTLYIKAESLQEVLKEFRPEDIDATVERFMLDATEVKE